MLKVPLTPAEVNDVCRGSMIGVRVVFLGSVARYPDKDVLVAAVRDFHFPPYYGSDDHSYATFRLNGPELYFFSIEPDGSLPKFDEDGTPVDGRVLKIGLCENQEFFKNKNSK